MGIKDRVRGLRSSLWKLAIVLVALVATGVVLAAIGSIISNTQHYPGTVTNQMSLTAPALGKNGTYLTWFVGVPKNVSVAVRPNSFVGSSHVLYDVNAANATCTSVTLTPLPFGGDSSTCSSTSGVVEFASNSKRFDGSTTRYWFFNMTFAAPASNASLNIWMVQD